MPTLLQINVVSNVLSTGKICEDIAKVAQSKGWQTYIAYGRWEKPGASESRRVGNNWDMYKHYVGHRFFDREGLESTCATKTLIRWIDEIKPDIIQLHNIHDHYLNYPILFEYLATLDTPIVWTQHDCWAYTGGCVYHDLYNCEQWREGCKGLCPNRRALFCNKSAIQFALKQELFGKIKNLTLVPVSNWLCNMLAQSFLRERRIMTIHNGIDIQKYHVSKFSEVSGCFRILGVAAVWDARKGLHDFIKLRSMLPAEYKITLVGLSQKQVKALPEGIKGITRTSDIEELVQLYSDADVFVNPTYSDNFPTTNLESLACGTPVITYRTGGSPEAIDEKTGVVVEQGNVNALANAITCMKVNPLFSEDCRRRAEERFNKDKCFERYVELYNQLINNYKS